MSIVFADKKMNSRYYQNTYIDLFCLILSKGNPTLCTRKNYNIDTIEFSKRDDVQRLTDFYKKELKTLWKSRKKQLKIAGINNSLPMLSEEKNNHPLNVEKNITSIPIVMNNHSQPVKITENTKIIFRLQNAKVGELYSAELQIKGETENKNVIIKKVLFSDEIGLSAVAPDFRRITGEPLKDGEHKVFVDYQFQNADTDRPMITAEFNLFINPDPKSLWKKKEPELNSPYFKQNEDKKLLQASDSRVMVAASKRGRSHEHSGTFRDDDFLLAFEHGWDIIAVADGAGSAKSSRKGSELAVYKSVEYLKNSLATHSEKIEQEANIWFANQSGSQHSIKSALYETFGRAAFAAVKAIEEEAASKSAHSKEYSTTLILAGHKKLPIGHLSAAYWVGDGGIGVYQEGEKIHLLGEVDSGEYAGQTRFLDKQMMTPDEIMKRLRFTITDDFTSLVLMTDGVTDPEFETDNNLARLQKWDELWNKLKPMLTNKNTAPDELLKWLDFWSPGNHDDRTIAILY